MPVAAIQNYVDHLEQHKAELSLMYINAATMPWAEKQDRSKAMRKLTSLVRARRVTPVVGDPAALAGIGIGVHGAG